MNKQQLAAKIWESANKMRSKIEANEYKDYILGFIFYKFLSEKEEKYLYGLGYTDEDINTVTEEDREIVDNVRKNIGYFVSYDSLFSTWIKKGKEFDISDVRDALSAFNRLINPTHKKVFEKIFETLETGLSKLGENAASQTKAARDLIHLIDDIPMDGRQDYDVLGFIYEYLISNFAANAGKKAGEFYTPHEVSLLMSEIVADHLKDKPEIKIYDPTSGSGSLLINIGKAVAKHMGDSDRIKYYAQELKENTYNLTRMNLVMRGIIPDNIQARNGDTLEDDWPYFDESDPIGTYDPLFVDAVVSNPPYSQQWDPKDREGDPRYARYGIAPKSKADYAFLLHDLYHLKSDGIMTIVLPHGVLFRGGEEGEIRKNLVENNNIDAIIGLPANIFFGTGIPTIIMVLKKSRTNTDVQIIDASKGFEKVGNNNKLRASDIKRISDAVTKRLDIDKFSRVVSRDEIRENDYNLNIPRYVDSSEKPESWDIYASMFGGVPAKELDDFNEFWAAFPGLKEALFDFKDKYADLKLEDIKQAIYNHPSVGDFKRNYAAALDGFDHYVFQELLQDPESVPVAKEEAVLSDAISGRLEGLPLVDSYDAYQALDNQWNTIGVDLEIIQTEGFEATKTVDRNMVTKKKNGKDVEEQDGWIGHVIPFDLVQNTILQRELDAVRNTENRLNDISFEYEEMIDALSEEDKEHVLNDDNTAFVQKAVNDALKKALEDVETDETRKLKEYQTLKTKEKLIFIENHPEIQWTAFKQAKNGTYTVSNKSMLELKMNAPFEEDSYEDILVRTSRLMDEEKEKKKRLKMQRAELETKTKQTIEGLTDEQVSDLLEMKWIAPLADALLSLPNTIIRDFAIKIEALSNKYKTTFSEVEEQIRETEKELSNMIDMLVGDTYDMEGLAELKKLLGD